MVAKSQSVEWFKAFTQTLPNDTDIVDMKLDGQGNIYLVGNVQVNRDGDLLIIKYAPSGDVLWYQRVGESKAYLAPASVIVDASDNIYIAGTKLKADPFSFLYKYDTNGKLLWKYESTIGSYDREARGVAVDTQGNAYLISHNSDSRHGTLVSKFNSAGNLLWRAKTLWSNGDIDYVLVGVAIDALGNVYVGGNSFNSHARIGDFIVMKYKPDGTLAWKQTYNSKYNLEDRATSICLDDNGNLFIIGYASTPSTGTDILIAKYDTNGRRLWTSLYNGVDSKDDYPTSATLDNNGNLYVTGIYYDSNQKFHTVTMSYTPTGKRMWIALYVSTATNGEWGTDIVVDGNANTYITGVKAGPDDANIFMLRNDMNGKRLKTITYTPKGFRIASTRKIVRDATGNLYISGIMDIESKNYISRAFLLKFKP